MGWGVFPVLADYIEPLLAEEGLDEKRMLWSSEQMPSQPDLYPGADIIYQVSGKEVT